jgi:hypothetical protein
MLTLEPVGMSISPERAVSDLEDLGNRWLAAFSTRDFDALEGLLDPEVRFRALVPRGLREATGPVDAVRWVRLWFGDSDVFAIRSAAVEVVADKVKVDYRVDVHEEDAWSTVDQTLYGAARDGRFVTLDVLCSGFREIEAPADMVEKIQAGR